MDDDEQEEEEDERDEGGEGEEEQEGEEGEGEGRFCLGQEHDSRAVREPEGSEWPPDFQIDHGGAVERAHIKKYKDVPHVYVVLFFHVQGMDYREG